MKDEKVTKTKLYTFDEMKDAVAQTIADMAQASSRNDDYSEPAKVFLMEMTVGAKILGELDKRHKEGEL